MQPFSFGMRKSSAESVDDTRSRYVPSSIYSGHGPIDDSPAIGPPAAFTMASMRGALGEQQTPRFMPPSRKTRESDILKTNDPVAMHLLAETAISDSRDFEILSLDEVEELKRERKHLRNKVDTTRRKLALESKLRDAAQSLNRLYSTRDKAIAAGNSPKRSRRSLIGSRTSAGEEVVTRADDEYAASSRKVEEFTQELSELERRLEYTERRILEHTAGILQLTHKGLKKNLRRTELPRSPESMTSQSHDPNSGTAGIDDFDERSLYQVPDYVTNFGQIPQPLNKNKGRHSEAKAIDDIARRLQEFNDRLHLMITQVGSQEHFDPPPQPTDEHMLGPVDAQIRVHLGYLSQGLGVMEAAQARGYTASQKSVFDSEDQLEDLNNRLRDMLESTNSVGQSPSLPQEEPMGKDLTSQLAFSTAVLDRLNHRIVTLVEQKDILTRQIQQQRELNSKSDAQRDAKIHELSEQLEEARQVQTTGEAEAQHARDQIHLLMEQLDLAKQENALLEQQRNVNDSKALEMDRSARKEMEDKLMTDLQAKQEELGRLHSEMNQLRLDSESKTQQLVQQIEELKAAKDEADKELESHRAELAQIGAKLTGLQAERDETCSSLREQIDRLETAKAEAETELSKARNEMQELESEVVRAQTELTMVKAELDGAYGTRAQRAADVSMNPAIQKVIDDLNARNKDLEGQLDFLQTQHETKGVGSAELQNKVNALQKELKETIEDYEIMTKQSIDDEKERERLEETVDALQQRCDTLESQLNEEKIKWLGAKVGSPNETTSTMVLKNEFKKMMRETRAENLKTLKAEQEERRRLESIIKSFRKDRQQARSSKDVSTPRQGL